MASDDIPGSRGGGNGRGGGDSVQRGTHASQGGGEMSVREAGRMGGRTRREQLGPAGWSELGRLGGEARREQLGSQGYSRLGRLGGQRVRELVEKGKRAEGGPG